MILFSVTKYNINENKRKQINCCSLTAFRSQMYKNNSLYGYSINGIVYKEIKVDKANNYKITKKNKCKITPYCLLHTCANAF